MRHLLQPQVLKAASIAAALSALACYPRLSHWETQTLPVWYLEAVIFLCCIVLWGFVFAWHGPYAGRPVFIFKQELTPLVTATLTGIGMATVFHLWLDPVLRAKFPEEYPQDVRHWLASTAFSMALSQLFLVFAPFDWLMRLAKTRWMAMVLTALFAASLQAVKIHSLTTPMPPLLEATLLVIRFTGGLLAAWFYLRGGAVLVWWWALLLVCRHLLDFSG